MVEVMRMRTASKRMQAKALSDVTGELMEDARIELCDALLEDFRMALDKEPTVRTPQRRAWWRRILRR